MSQQMSLERMVADWMVDETAGGLPEHVFDQIVTTTSRRRPLPRWLAVLREPEMRAQSQVAVGMPRRPLILIGVALLLAAAIAIGVGAATLLRPQPSTDVWPGFRGDASRAGLGVTGPEGNPVVRWTFPATGSVSSSIAVAGDLVLAPSDDGLLHARANLRRRGTRWCVRVRRQHLHAYVEAIEQRRREPAEVARPLDF